MISENNTVLKIITSQNAGTITVRISAQEKISAHRWKVTGMDGKVLKEGFSKDVNGSAFEFDTSFEAEMWSIENPNLYGFNIALEYEGGKSENLNTRFGFRYITFDDKYIYLNGYPFYMRGYIRGHAAHEHENNCRLSPIEFYRKNIKRAKEFGFNTIRFHSTIPPEECFQAADELGMMIHIEIRSEADEYHNLTEMLGGASDLATADFIQNVVDKLYNHPSLMVYCLGNEIKHPGKNPNIRKLRDIIKKADPTRLFIDTCAHGEYDRDYVDFDVQHMSYFFPYGRHANMYEDTYNLLCFGSVAEHDMVVKNDDGVIRRAIHFPRPVIAHEICHYTALRDVYTLKEKFEKYGVEKPWWIEEEIKMIEAKGYKEKFDVYLRASKRFQYKCWKTAFEALRASRFLSGFHMLQFADTDRYENSNGLVDCFDDYQGLMPEEFRVFNSDTVLLARLPGQVFETGQTVDIPVLLSQFKISPAKKAVFRYELQSESGKKVLSDELQDVDTSKCGLYDICKLQLKMPALKKSEAFRLICELEFDDNTAVKNYWDLWVFGKKSLEVDAEFDLAGDYIKLNYKEKPGSRLIVTDKLDDSLFEKLEQGKDVILLYRTDWTRHLLNKGMNAPKYSFEHTWDRFKPTIWDRGTNNGGIVNGGLLTKYGFVSGTELDFKFYPLIDDSDKINLDNFPVKVTSLVSGIDKSARDRFDVYKFKLSELQYDRTLRNFSYAFELRAGKGRLLVTGFNFTGIAGGNPAVCAMFEALVSYCNSDDFNPKSSIGTDELRAYLKAVAQKGPQKERMMTQYWQLDDEPVESKEYWIESERYLRE